MKEKLVPTYLVELFAVVNLAFLGGDIFIAHSANAFARTPEWFPLIFSALAALVLAPSLLSPRLWARWRWPALVVGGLAVVVGVAGMLYHLESGFFRQRTLHDLVYSAPFAAPLAYVGVGLLLVLSRLEVPGSLVWCQWVIFLALGGFVGNFALSLGDHAQNGFASAAEWIPVAAAALAVGFLAVAMFRPGDRRFRRITLALMGVELAVAVAGVVFHWIGILASHGPDFSYQLFYGPPAFAPLLFANLALLAGLGLWGFARIESGLSEHAALGVRPR
ncbi:MAG: hypothetical protein U1F43_03885 [Myxococcota bacterium]